MYKIFLIILLLTLIFLHNLVQVVARMLPEMERAIAPPNAGTNLVKQREDVLQGKLRKQVLNFYLIYLMFLMKL